MFVLVHDVRRSSYKQKIHIYLQNLKKKTNIILNNNKKITKTKSNYLFDIEISSNCVNSMVNMELTN